MNLFRCCTAISIFLTVSVHAKSAEPLPSWHASGSKQAIVSFVERVTKQGSTDFVPRSARIAVFDNDGTLWAEQPMYVQAYFAFDRVKQLAETSRPEWKDTEPFASVVRGELKPSLFSDKQSLLELLTATHSGMTTDEFSQVVTAWLAKARHPKTGRAFTEMVYQPMLELLDYLRSHGFKTFIVTGGGIDFVRPWAHRVYGIPPEQVIGSSIRTEYVVRDGQPAIVRLPEVDFIDDKAGKPVGIGRHIGRRPLMAFGNSDGDFEMLEYTTAGSGPRLGVLVHHTDAKREWAYDRQSHIGRLEKGLDQSADRHWVLVSMKDDWKTVFPPPTPVAVD